MKSVMWDTIKVFIIFIACTFLFYFGLHVIHSEYEEDHRYDPPEGAAVKVFNVEQSFIDRLNIFFRLGE